MKTLLHKGGETATDPAKMFNIYYKNLGTFDLTYISNNTRVLTKSEFARVFRIIHM